MKRISILLIIFTAFSLLISADIDIVTTTSDLAAIASEIGGDKVKVQHIAMGYEDPHHLLAKPSYILKANKADIWIRIGMELEIGWEPNILSGARNSDILVGSMGFLDVSDRIRKLDVPLVADRSMGDVHPEGNPHYWLDPMNGRIIAEEIAEKLSKLYPEYADYFDHNFKEFITRLDIRMFGEEAVKKIGGKLLWKASEDGTLKRLLVENNLKPAGWYGRMLPYQGLKYIAYHSTWVYFNRRFRVETAEYIEPKPGLSPTPSHLASLVKLIGSEKITLLIQSVHYSTKASEYLHAKTGLKVMEVASSVGGKPEIKDYFSLIDGLVDAFTVQDGGK
ncbi:MAG: metal ABC transporter substrate-binding protein [Acidobacteria bacterium]|nr:metal ABC transporter substrate-binding protein [Acidobacteriota bacterium]